MTTRSAVTPEHMTEAKRVAERLAPILAHAGADHTDIDTLPEPAWAMAVTLARVAHPDWHPRPGYLPSNITRNIIAAILKPAPNPTDDPFAGLPS